MMRSSLLVLRATVAALLLLLVGCERCAPSGNVLAELENARGAVSRDRASALHEWEKAPIGAEFRMGDGVRTGQKSDAGVVFDDGTRMALNEATTVRFLETKPGSGERGLKVEAGEVTLDVQKAELLLRTEVGLARVEPGSVIRIGRGDKGLRFFVKVGKALLESGGDRRQELGAGEGVEVTVNLAVVERFGEPASNAAPEPSGSPPAEDTGHDATASWDSQPIVAVVSGPGTRMLAPGQTAWTALSKGETTLSPGTRLRLDRGAKTDVRRGDQNAALGGPGEYLIEGAPDRFLAMVSGTTVLRADGMDVGMEVADGNVVAQGSREPSVAEVSLKGGEIVGVTARQGSVLVNIRGKQETLRPGESVTVSPKGEQQVFGRGVPFSDVVLGAGQSLAVHDPDPPLAVGFTFEKVCPERGVVELLGGRGVAASAAGVGGANLRVPSGRHTYRVRCLRNEGPEVKAAARGSVTVVHDAGTAPLAAGAPATFVDADGRSYMVLYQNRLPQVTVRWPHPPGAQGYVLVHQSPSGTRSVPTAGPTHTFASGAFAEGRHVLTYRAADKQSRPTNVTVRFDPAAPKASIQSPSNGGFAPNSTVDVSGIALPGWQVYAGPNELALDPQHRFSGRATAGDRVLLIRFQHPSRGSELYLRRASGVPR